MIFVDTNYFLRFLLADNTNQHEEAKKLFNCGAQGKVKLFTSTIVFFEIYWVLSSFYQKNKTELCPLLQDILKLEFITLTERTILSDAIAIFENGNLSFEDCYNLCYAKKYKVTDFRTFDKILQNKFSAQ
ncbi:MAG: PilT protein domain protein [Berkelbacteria bacterium GW2011_GWA2_35_9]|uniref:PilT protein domain protein n=1 Tax=Berkelbacteria bacterium GW2011_GWA2_35_9 TaxID=1618333 RepID=A0A0G0D537_9BACT|nr:MAG: PilT protein domain protein [Berkelbacteria bacterium GW2011_GWA2_35_9]